MAIFGALGVGKTSLIEALKTGPYSSPDELQFANDNEEVVRLTRNIDGKEALLVILDTIGENNAEWELYDFIINAEAILLVYAVNSRESFETLSNIKETIIKIRTHHSKDIPVLMLVAHKIDIIGTRAVSRQEGELLANQWGASYHETSAVAFTSKAYKSIFIEAAELLKNHHQTVAASKPSSSSDKRQKGCNIQ